MTNHFDVVEALRHARHDWLNIMQLIKGNLALKRYDRIADIIDEVARQSSSESEISNIQAPSVSYFLLTFNWFCREMKLEMDVAGDVFSLAKQEQELLRICKQIIERLARESTLDTENHLLLTFLFTDQQCELTFDYQGTLQQEGQSLVEYAAREPAVELVEVSKQECVLLTRFTRS
ncbi:sporulation initiation phosphotransferase B [Alkalihalobacillus oceani]|uniref:Sporulation initiation phosphotransferase B n=1 Tax=Halalkalibacter oceani TaxID=1653776 RepID=A0A9X2DNS4_9BACI|nr:Spo0B C-terminal domain-containing protein [Halalkalibacter oceani]MCM3712662.1 sporulation initiation phosphotransferase B [Halalkalibacter oceani]